MPRRTTRGTGWRRRSTPWCLPTCHASPPPGRRAREELRVADLVLSEHARGDLTHVVGPVLDRIPLLGAVVEGSADLAPDDRAGGEAALEVIEGAVMATHAADLLPPDRRARLAAPWRAAWTQGYASAQVDG